MLTGRSAAGCVDTVARGNNIALCVVVPDMPRLSLDELGLPARSYLDGDQRRDGTVAVKQYRGRVPFVLLGYRSDAAEQLGCEF